MAMPNELLRAARESSPSRILPGEPMSRSELADAANEYLFTTTGERYDLDRHQIARYERGEVRWPSAPYRTALRAVLGADNDASLGFTRGSRSSASTVALPGGATSEGWEAASVIATAEEMTRHDVTLSRRQAITAAGGFAAGAALTDPLQAWLTPRAAAARGTVRLNPVEVATWEEIVTRLRRWSAEPTGMLLRKAAIAQLSGVNDQLREVGSGPEARRGFRAAAELASITGSMSWDAGLHPAAQRYYTLAVQYAKVADDPALAARYLAAFARQCFDLGHPDDGLELVQLAQYGTRKVADPGLRALLATREAWAYAQLGQHAPFRRSVLLAEDHFAEYIESTGERSAYGLDRAELHGVIGARYRDFAKHEPTHAEEARRHITAALELRDSGRPRNRAFDLIALARVHLITAEPEHACELIHQTLALASDWSKGRVGTKLRDFHGEAARFGALPAVRETRDRIADVLTA